MLSGILVNSFQSLVTLLRLLLLARPAILVAIDPERHSRYVVFLLQDSALALLVSQNRDEISKICICIS